MLDGSQVSISASEDSASLHSAASMHRPLVKQSSDSEINRQRNNSLVDSDAIGRSASEKSRVSPGVRGMLRSLPPSVSVTIEDDSVSCGGLSNITEGEEMKDSGSSQRSSLVSRRSAEREVSPGALERPTSPDGGTSPGTSPRASRKRRLASKRQTKGKLSTPSSGI